MKTQNPFSYAKQQFGGFRTSGRKVMRGEAERLLGLLEGSIEERATGDIEMEVADSLGLVENGEDLLVTVIQDKVGEDESSNKILKSMEYGGRNRLMTKPILNALRSFEE